MNTMNNELVEPFRRMLEDISTPAAIRAAEAKSGVPPMWQDLVESGFLDALLPEDKGGAGLTLSDVFPLVAATGEYGLPAPFAETMLARAIIAERGGEAPADAAIILAPAQGTVPLAGAATHALVKRGQELALLPINGGKEDPFHAGGGEIDTKAKPVLTVAMGNTELLSAAAGLVAAKMAGAMVRIMEMTTRYAEERQQFGRSLSKFQVIQHHLAVLAEQVASSNVAARIGMSGTTFDPLRVAVAKTRTSEASHQVCAIAHAVHGAIGATEEYDLQLFTRRLKQWQLTFGSESYWATRLGEARLAAPAGTSADFVRLNLQEKE